MTRSRTVTWSPPTPPPPELSGLQSVQALIDGTLAPPPVAALVGIAVTHAEPGLVRLALHPAEYHYNPLGTVHGGIAATLLEMALAAAIRTTLPAGQACITIEIKVNYIRALTTATGPITAEAKVVHAGRQVALAEGRVTDAAGRLYASATSTCLIQDAPAPTPPTDRPRHWDMEWDDPVAGARALAGKPGLEALRGQAFAPPISRLIGMQAVAFEPGCVTMHLPPAEHLFSQFGVVHGGMVAALLDSVMGCAIHTVLPVGRGYTTLELHLTFLRPITAASGTLIGTGLVLHEGARMATAEARAVDAAGRLCATGTTTCFVFDARPPS